MSTRSLPPRPDLTQLKIQARELWRAHRAGKRPAAARIAAHHPRLHRWALHTVLEHKLSLSDAQLVVAREYGFDNWAALKHRVELGRRVAMFTPHPHFAAAVAALDAGDLSCLRELLASNPTLVHARTNLEPPYGYFSAATLLHHVAGNPDRAQLPANIVDLARLLLDQGADVNAETLGRNGGTTLGLVITSRQASEADVAGGLIDLLLQRGAKLDVDPPGLLDVPLSNHAPRAAEKLIELGARPDVCAAAALGRMDLVRASFDEEGRLLAQARPRRHGALLGDRDAIGLAMLFAYVNKHRAAVEFLLRQEGNWDMVGVLNGTALHRAAWDGDLPMLERLVALGADIGNRNNPFVATPFSWANHNQQAAAVHWMRTTCAIDLHDAVSFDLREHVAARLREDPALVNSRLDQWHMPQCTPLHCAAATNREDLVRLLLNSDANPNILAGNGMTPLDIAEVQHATGVATLITERGGRRATEL